MANYTVGYKAFRVGEDGQLRFLFHSYREPGADKGSSIVPLDRWITTKRPWGREAQGKKYRLAFHFLRYERDIAAFQRLTKHKYLVLPVHVRKIEPKPRTSVGSWLAVEIRVPSAHVAKAKAEWHLTHTPRPGKRVKAIGAAA